MVSSTLLSIRFRAGWTTEEVNMKNNQEEDDEARATLKLKFDVLLLLEMKEGKVQYFSSHSPHPLYECFA